MTEEVPAAATMPACNGSVPLQDGPLQAIGGIGEIAKSLGTVPYANAETSPDTSPAEENLEENRNSLAEDIAPENFAGEKRRQGMEWGCLSLSVGRGKFWFICSLMDNGCAVCQSQFLIRGSWPGGTAGTSPGSEGTLEGSAHPRGNPAQEEEEEEEEDTEDTEEDEVQVIEMKKEKSEGPRPQQRDSDKGPSPPASPACNSPLDKAGPQPGLGKKNDISRHSYSRYNTISYRRIRKGNTKQRIDEFESMMHL
ncbi:ERMIN protein, partial [Sterrhoptilus dennistouni]|nr:ERMIN protein [Sterrhoptilus dennistouni]